LSSASPLSSIVSPPITRALTRISRVDRPFGLRTDAGAAATAADHRDRAIDFYCAAIDVLHFEVGLEPTWPWSVVPLAQARIRLAEALVGRGVRDVRDLVEPAVRTLAEVRDEVHVDRWDEALFAAGQRLLAR
jgi:hypothetical protein